MLRSSRLVRSVMDLELEGRLGLVPVALALRLLFLEELTLVLVLSFFFLSVERDLKLDLLTVLFVRGAKKFSMVQAGVDGGGVRGGVRCFTSIELSDNAIVGVSFERGSGLGRGSVTMEGEGCKYLLSGSSGFVVWLRQGIFR